MVVKDIMEYLTRFSYIGLGLLFTREFFISIYDINCGWVIFILIFLILVTYISESLFKHINIFRKQFGTNMKDLNIFCNEQRQNFTNALLSSPLCVSPTIAAGYLKPSPNNYLRSNKSFPLATSSSPYKKTESDFCYEGIASQSSGSLETHHFRKDSPPPVSSSSSCLIKSQHIAAANHYFLQSSLDYEKINTTNSESQKTDEDLESYFNFLDSQLNYFEDHSISLHKFSDIIHNREQKSSVIENINIGIFEIPIEVLIRYFNRPMHRLLGIQYIILASIHIEKISPIIAADLIRLLVRLLTHLPICEEILCERVLKCEKNQHRLTSYQLALTVWSVAKTCTKHSENDKNGTMKKYIKRLFDFIANETMNQIEEFQPLSIANIMWAYSKMYIRNEKLFHILAEYALKKIDLFNAQNIVNVYWSLGTLEIKNTVLTPNMHCSNKIKLTEVILTKLSSFNTQAIANFAWACAKLQWGHHLFISLILEAQNKLKFFKPQEIANFMWAVAKLKLTSLKPVITLFANHSAANIIRFNLQEVSNIYWCLGTLEIHDSKLTPSDLVEFEDKLDYDYNINKKFSSINYNDNNLYMQHSSLDYPSRLSTNNTATIRSYNWDNNTNPGNNPNNNPTYNNYNNYNTNSNNSNNYYKNINNLTSKGESSIDTMDHNMYNTESQILLQALLQKVENFNAQATANVLWTCGKLQWKCAPLCHALEQAIIKNINTLRPQNTANCLWALAKLRTKRINLIHLLVDTACSQLVKFNTQEIANIYWALGTLEINSTALTPSDQLLTNDTIKSDFSCINDICYNNYSYNKNSNSNFYADTTSCVFNNETTDNKHQDAYYVCRIVLEKLQYYKPQELANFIWACARLKWKHMPILEKSCLISLKLANQFKPQEVGNLLWGLAKLNYRHIELTTALCNDAAEKLNQYIPQNISNIYWALASLEVTNTVLTSNHPKFAKLKCLLNLIKKFNQQEIVNFVWACYKLNWNHPDVMFVAAQVVFSQVEHFQMIDILNLQQAFKKLGYKSVAKQLIMVNCESMC